MTGKRISGPIGLVTLTLTLAACGQQIVEVEKPVERIVEVEKPVERIVERIVTVDGELPFVPIRGRAATPDCGDVATTSGRSARDLRDFRARTFVPLKSGLSAQTDLPDNLQTALFSVRTLLNREYHGPAATDRQALHAKYGPLFKSAYPNGFASYAQDVRSDAMVSRYVSEMNDGHTAFIPNALFAALRAEFSNGDGPAPSFGLDPSPVPDADGAVLRWVRHDGPAFAAGLRRGDVILAVDDRRLTREATPGETAAKYRAILDLASRKADGAVFVVSRAGAEQTVTISAKVLGANENPWAELRSTPGGKQVLHLMIPTFLSFAVADTVHAYVRAAGDAALDGVVVDLRDNTGGYIVMNDGAAGAFTDRPFANVFENLDANDVSYGYADGELRISTTCGEKLDIPLQSPALWKGRTVVLLNERSASASEFFARTVSELGGARLVGTRTAGVANSSTALYELPGERAMAVTNSLVRGPDGRVRPDDITPHEEVADDLAKLAAGTDAPLTAALDWLDR